MRPWALPVIVLLGVLSSLAEGIGIGLFIPFLQNIDTGRSQGTAAWLINVMGGFFEGVAPESRLYVVAACIFGAAVFKAVLYGANQVLFHWLDGYFVHRLRSKIFDKLLTVNYSYLERTPSGSIVNTLTTETDHTSWALTNFVKLIVAGCTVFVLVGLVLLISWKMTLAVGAIVVVVAIAMRPITKRAQIIGNQETAENSLLSQRIMEGIAGMQVIRAFGAQADERKRFERQSRMASRSRQKRRTMAALIVPFYEVLAAAMLAAILCTTIGSPGDLPAVLVFIVVLFRLYPNVIEIGHARVNLAGLAEAVNEVTSLAYGTNMTYLSSGARPCRDLRDAIRLEDVSYRYRQKDRAALEGVTLRIPANKTTAIVGPSGAGKSTLIKLIFRFYDVLDGEIYVDEVPLRELDLTDWRSRMAMVSQDVFIFNTTVRQNIAYGRPGATDDEIFIAAQQAKADGFINKLPRGYDSNIGERGVRLSGGQKQRIALARAIIRNPSILILDEATNALDSLSERFIQNTLDTLSENRTVIVIAHRMSTVERADHIIVLDEGRVREQGDRQLLLQKDGLFAQLHGLQYGTKTQEPLIELP